MNPLLILGAGASRNLGIENTPMPLMADWSSALSEALDGAEQGFRHTCASLLFAEGRNVKQVAQWLGHADPAFTLRVYVSLLDEGLGEGLELNPFSGTVIAAPKLAMR